MARVDKSMLGGQSRAIALRAIGAIGFAWTVATAPQVWAADVPAQEGPAAAAMAAQLADEHATLPASATTAPIGASQAVGDPHDPVYLAFGGKDGIRKIVNDLYAELLIDPRTKTYFDGAPIERIETLLTEQICSLLNGPCVYTGRSMRRTHAGQNINRAAFNALVEDLEDAMDKNKVPYRYQTRLLAKLAPMYRDVQDRP